MNLSQIILKNIKYNIKSYTAYLIGNTFIIAILFMFFSLLSSNVFMKVIGGSHQDSSEMLEAMITLMAAFSVVFILYTTISFTKYRGKEFGVYFTIGLTSKNIIKILSYENLVIAASSFILGAFFGTLFSKIFYMAILKTLNMTNINIKISLKPYIYITLIAVLIFVFNILYQIIFLKRLSISQILKSNSTKYVGKTNFIWGIMGIVILIIAMSTFQKAMNQGIYRRSTVAPMILCSILACIISLYFVIGSIMTLILKISKRFKSFYNNNILCLNSLSHRFIEYRSVLYVSILLIASGIALISISYSIYKSSKDSIDRLYPYDLSFVIEKDLYNLDLKDVLETSGAHIKSFNTLQGINVLNLREYSNQINWMGIPIMATSQNCFNKLNKQNINVTQNHALFYYADLKDTHGGLIVDFSKEEDYKISKVMSLFNRNKVSLNDYIKFKNNKGFLYIPYPNVIYKQGNISNAFNSSGDASFIPFMRWNSIILSDEDYAKLKENSSPKLIYYDVLVNLYNNDDCKVIEKNLSQKLNKIGGEKLKDTLTLKELKLQEQLGNTNFTLFTFVFFGMMLLIGSAVTLYFKVFTSIEDDRNLVNQLIRIGLTQKEINAIIIKEIAAVFLISPLIAISVISYYISRLYIDIPFGRYMWANSLVVFAIYGAIQITFFLLTTSRYLKEIMN
ncbi:MULTISPECIES: FtsX-like permease family protein [Clostridium]|uniref:FtsX-like permease family protein n=1 Tax=Clostridium TaxID=1485 RepID=UPI000824C4B2|nr:MULTISPECIES: ABC transporter permease [Clostridium]PJI08478.1 ABC transporter permease [Clostridium sp. CT7]